MTTREPPDHETAQERERKAAQIAYDKGAQDERVEGHLREHDRHFKEINGSVAELAQGQKDLAAEQVETNVKLEAILKSHEVETEVSAALAASSLKLADRTVTRRTLILVALGVVIALGSLMIAGLTLVHTYGQPAPAPIVRPTR